MYSWLLGGVEERKPTSNNGAGDDKCSKPSGTPPTPPVVVGKPWPATVERPKEGEWTASLLETKLFTARPTPPEKWLIRDSAKHDSNELELLAGDGEACVLQPVPSACAASGAALPPPLRHLHPPSLLQADWVAVGRSAVHWLQKDAEHRLTVLTQDPDAVAGGFNGTLRLLVNEVAQDEDPAPPAPAPRDTSLPVWSRCALAHTSQKPWWFQEGEHSLPEGSGEQVCALLPRHLQKKRFGMTGYVWVSVPGWLGTSEQLQWMILYDRALFFSPHPHSQDVEEFDLEKARLKPFTGIVLGAGQVSRHSLTLVGPSKELTVFCRTEAERDFWGAVIDITIAQLNPGVETLHNSLSRHLRTYENILLHKPFPKQVPCVSIFSEPEAVYPARLSGYAVVEAGTGGGLFSSMGLSDGWKRRWVTVHESWLTLRDSNYKEALPGLRCVPLLHAALARSPHPENAWVFSLHSAVITDTFGGPIQVWCDGASAFAKWLAACDAAVRSANSGLHSGSHPQTLQVLRSDNLSSTSAGDPDLRSHLTSGHPFVLSSHGVTVPQIGGPLAMPHVQTSAWKALVSSSAPPVIGSEGREAEWDNAGELRWRKEAGEREAEEEEEDCHLPPPVHMVVRGRKFEDKSPLPGARPHAANVVTTCLLPETVLGDRCVVLAYPQDSALKVVSCLMTISPSGTRTLLRSEPGNHWLCVLSGTVSATLFPAWCYSLITPSFPACRDSSVTTPVPPNWQSPSDPLADLPGAQATLLAGQALFVPAGYFYALRHTSESVTLTCKCPNIRN